MSKAEVINKALEVGGEVLKDKNVLDTGTNLLKMFFPFLDAKRKAVEIYEKEIIDSNHSNETKAYMLYNVKKIFKEWENQKKIANIALNELKEETNFSSESGVDEEWFNRYMDSAKFVSSEEMQLIWGKILAHEFESPNSTPHNMIRILSEITPELAETFKNICNMSIEIFPLNENGDIDKEKMIEMVIISNEHDDLVNKFGISYNKIVELESLGIVKQSDFESTEDSITAEKLVIRIEDKIDVVEKYNKGNFPVGNIILTNAGKYLKKITESTVIDGYYEATKEYFMRPTRTNENKIIFSEKHNFALSLNGDIIKTC